MANSTIGECIALYGKDTGSSSVSLNCNSRHYWGWDNCLSTGCTLTR